VASETNTKHSSSSSDSGKTSVFDVLRRSSVNSYNSNTLVAVEQCLVCFSELSTVFTPALVCRRIKAATTSKSPRNGNGRSCKSDSSRGTVTLQNPVNGLAAGTTKAAARAPPPRRSCRTTCPSSSRSRSHTLEEVRQRRRTSPPWTCTSTQCERGPTSGSPRPCCIQRGGPRGGRRWEDPARGRRLRGASSGSPTGEVP
jgi:hypothetical protein